MEEIGLFPLGLVLLPTEGLDDPVPGEGLRREVREMF